MLHMCTLLPSKHTAKSSITTSSDPASQLICSILLLLLAIAAGVMLPQASQKTMPFLYGKTVATNGEGRARSGT
jgi:hypothetical protein